MNDWIATFTNGHCAIQETGTCRFPNDHVMMASPNGTLLLNGLILNKKELFELYHEDRLDTLMNKMFVSDPYHFFNQFRGPFTGLVYDIQHKKAVVFTNQTGDSSVFYYLSDQCCVFSSNYTVLCDFLKLKNVILTLDEQAAHWMLTFGYLIDNHTFSKEIKRLLPGKALYLMDGVWSEKRVHQFRSENLQITEDEAIEKIDALFRQAVKRCFDKDLEYGYSQHLVDMSAGMDSRMVNYVAEAMGYQNITNLSYSETGSEEERLSKAMAAHLGHPMVFGALDDHEFIYDIDTLLRGNYGTYLYTGITGGARLLSTLDWTRFGAEQTGQLGDIAIGTFVKTDSLEVDPEAVRLSHWLPLRFDPNPEGFQNQDLYSLYTRGFLGAMSSWFIRKEYTYALSPFTDVDFMGFCYSLPTAMRRNHNLYWKWVKKYYPDALTVPTSRKRVPVTMMEKTLDFMKKAFHKGLKITRKGLFKMGLASSRIRKDSSMNPYEYWYDTDPKMREFLNNYYNEHLPLLDSYPDTKRDVEILFNSEKVLEKLMALTVLGEVRGER